ncbi:MAG TPA: flagellar filament capping protein FliD [Oligoflexia bacterium]|nr:flagellar filament capping protein FliD [Oligoflexia bacterium]HMP47639.1 flagellar filament capping protein FliD [Oligoflexia bacterium]
MPSVQFSGLASGIDSGALIDSLIEARQVRNDIRRKQITDIQAETESLVELKSKISSLSDLLDKFRTANGGGIGKRASSQDPSVLTATASPTAINAAYTINVISKANSATASYNNSYGSLDSVLSATGGTLNVTVGTGGDEVIINQAVTSGVTTLSDFITAFNANPQTAGRVYASAVNVGSTDSPDFRLMFTTLESGASKGSISFAGGVADMTSTTISQATDAVFSVSGIGGNITRSSNTISDIISGVTFTIADVGESVITVTNDADRTVSEMQEFVDAFNDLVTFINENNKVERVESGRNVTNIFGSLAKTRVDRDFISSFRLQLSSASSSGVETRSMAQLGIITNRDGTLTFNEELFKEGVSKDVAGATGVINDFADRVAGVNGTMYQYTKFNGLIDIAMEANNGEIENISRAIAQLDRQTDKIREGLTLRFANLESITGRLQGQQQALTGILAGLSK